MKKIILDTNFLMIPTQFKVDIFSEIDRVIDGKHEFFIISGTVDELNKLISDAKKGSDKGAARIGLQLIEHKKIKKIGSDKGVDDALLEQKDAIIATLDSELERKLHKKGIKTIGLRKKSFLILKP